MGTPPVDRQIDGWKDRRVSKHHLPVILRTRAVKIGFGAFLVSDTDTVEGCKVSYLIHPFLIDLKILLLLFPLAALMFQNVTNICYYSTCMAKMKGIVTCTTRPPGNPHS